MSLHNYHDTFKVFPPAKIYSSHAPTKNVAIKNTPIWMLLLPFMEQGPLHAQYNFSVANNARVIYDGTGLIGSPAQIAVNEALARTRISALECPSHSAAGEKSSGTGVSYARTNQPRSSYLACTGYHTDYNSDWEPYRNDVEMFRQGAFGNNGAAKMAHITDGLSNTTVFGEAWGGRMYKCSESYGPWGLSGIHTSVHGRVVSGWAVGTYSSAQWASWARDWHINSNYQSHVPSNWCAVRARQYGVKLAYAWAFNSGHPGGAQFAFADGSARFLSETMDYKTFCLANYISDSQVIAP